MAKKTRLVHNGTVSTAHGGYKVGQAVGAIYLGDIGRRMDHLSSESALGQDFYLNPGDDLEIVETGEVLLSVEKGELKALADLGVVSITTGITA